LTRCISVMSRSGSPVTRNEIGELAFFNGSEAVLLVKDFGVVRGRHAQGVGRRRPPFHEHRERLPLYAV
jgi:hypothetical protein